jgi:hypothetical protein
VTARGHDRFVFRLFAAAQVIATQLEVHGGRSRVRVAGLWHNWPCPYRSDTSGVTGASELRGEVRLRSASCSSEGRHDPSHKFGCRATDWLRGAT